MFRRIVVAANGSEESYGAVRWALSVAPSIGAHTEVVDVVAGHDREMDSVESLAHLADVRDRLSAHLVERELGVDQVVVEHGFLTDVLAGRSADVDLIVLGAHSVEARLAGHHHDLVSALAREVDHPIAMVPPGDWFADEMPIVVGIDGSDGNRAVFRWARWFARQVDRRLVAVHVSDPLGRSFEPSGRLSREDVAVRHELETSEAEFVERTHADPGRSLAEYAAIRDAGLLVVGARVRHSLGGRLLGGVTADAVDLARCPVVVVPRDYQISHR